MRREIVELVVGSRILRSVQLRWERQQKAQNHAHNGDGHLVYVLIPGNPGVVEYYAEFLNGIYAENDREIDIVAVEHVGHSHGDHNDGKLLHNLDTQIEHKIAALRHFRDKNPQAHFVIAGHSVGAYICLQIMKRAQDLNIVQTQLLLPTMKYIGLTPNGRTMTPLLQDIPRQIATSLLVPLTHLPLWMKVRLVQLFTGQREQDATITAQYLIHHRVVNNALFMACTEMREITELDHETLEKHSHKIYGYYGQTDGWVPLDHYHEMKEKLPQGQTHLCDEDIPHAFVLGKGEKLAKKVSEPIFGLQKSKLQSQSPNGSQGVNEEEALRFLHEVNAKLEKLEKLASGNSREGSLRSSASLSSLKTVDVTEGESDPLAPKTKSAGFFRSFWK